MIRAEEGQRLKAVWRGQLAGGRSRGGALRWRSEINTDDPTMRRGLRR